MPLESLQQQYLKQSIKMERKLWKQEEDLALAELVKNIGLTNWTLVSIRLTQSCPGVLRTGKQCRQRWFNHLDDKISKMPWNKNQEQIIFDLHLIHGNRWKEITSHLKNRTENDVKNHFYAELRKGIRRMNKFLGFKKHPSTIRSIRPSVLSSVCEQQRRVSTLFLHEKSKNFPFNFYSDINTLIFQFSRGEPSQQQCITMLGDERIVKSIEKFLDRVIQENVLYLKKKQQKQKQLPKRKSAFQAKQNSDAGNHDFDISEYLCLDYQPSSPSSIHFKSEGLSMRSGSSSDERQSLRMSLQENDEKQHQL